jgi:hypothetical protein
MLPASARRASARRTGSRSIDWRSVYNVAKADAPARRVDQQARDGRIDLDLLDEPDRVIRGLKHFRFSGTDIIVFHVLDRDSCRFPSTSTRFRTGNRRSRARDPVMVRDHYVRRAGLIERYPARTRRRRYRLPPAHDRPALELGLMAYLDPEGHS